MEGKTSNEIRELEKQLGLDENDLIQFKAIESGGGESSDEIHERIIHFFKDHILKESREEKRYLIIAHGGTVLVT